MTTALAARLIVEQLTRKTNILIVVSAITFFQLLVGCPSGQTRGTP